VDTLWINKVLLEALNDPCVEIREIIIKELGRRENTDLDLVCEKLTKLPWYVKSGSLRILEIKKDPQTIKSIAPLIKEMNADVRMTTAQVLGKIGGKEAVALLAKLVKDENHFVRVSAENALRKTSDLKFS
jgi:HEAT repeat protein